MTDTESIEIDQDTAKRLLLEGATFIFLGVPIGMQFGIDMKSWSTGEKFKGVKMIPPGIHFVYYRYVVYSCILCLELNCSVVCRDIELFQEISVPKFLLKTTCLL